MIIVVNILVNHLKMFDKFFKKKLTFLLTKKGYFFVIGTNEAVRYIYEKDKQWILFHSHQKNYAIFNH